MTDTPIRTHATTTVGGSGMPYAFLPSGWEPGTPVLVVAGLPEGATIKPLCRVPLGWEVETRAGSWTALSNLHPTPDASGLVVCRPKPVTERVDWSDSIGRQAHYAYETTWGSTAEIKGALFDAVSSPHGFVVDRRRNRIRDINSDGMVEVLVEDATRWKGQ